MTSDRIGHFDAELFARFRAAKGPRRRMLLNQLVLENAPLVKLLVDQLRGGPDARKRPGTRAMGGCQGFRELEWEDAFQAGLVGLARALEGLDLSKGKLAGYAKLWIRHELQRLVYNGGALVRVPRGAGDQVPVALSGDQQEIDRLSGGVEDGLAALEGMTPEDLARWEETGEWPESLEALRAARDTRTPLQRFLEANVVFRANARCVRAHLFERWDRHVEPLRPFLVVRVLREVLEQNGVRPIGLRVPWADHPVSGFAGVALKSSSRTGAGIAA